MTASPTLIPVNRLARAKGRLAELLSPEERETLALITLETVLHAAGDGAVVLTPDDRVRAAVGKRARVMDEDPHARGLSGFVVSVSHSLLEAFAESFGLGARAARPNASQFGLSRAKDGGAPRSAVCGLLGAGGGS